MLGPVSQKEICLLIDFLGRFFLQPRGNIKDLWFVDESEVMMRLSGADAAFDIVWDKHGIPHIYASTIADAYRGMGFAAGKERLWQIHQSTAYAMCEAAALLGERFIPQDALQRACNVHGTHTGLPESEGDWIVDAYLDGLNAVIDGLDESPPEFIRAGAKPRRFNRADIAARYRFTSWFQHKSWTEKIALGRLMATHGVDWFRHHVLHLSDADEESIAELRTALKEISITPFVLAYPEAESAVLSGSNNWAISGQLSASGKAMLATDPHQPHTIPNTFFYVHLHAPGWDVFGAAFPGVPYFMMGTTRDIAWGLTTGFVDCYDVFVEETNPGDMVRNSDSWVPLLKFTEQIEVKGGETRTIEVVRSERGPLLERLTRSLDMPTTSAEGFETALQWSLTDVPTSAGALARLPLAGSAEEFGHLLFEDDVCPLVNNIICVDKDDGLRRFIAATLPARSGVTGSVPLSGSNPRHQFRLSNEAELTVEIDPGCGYSLTANNDTMGESGPFYIHNFPTHSARAGRVREILEVDERFTVTSFKEAQLDITDLRARQVLPGLLAVLKESDDDRVALAYELLFHWDCQASKDAGAPCIYYPFLDRLWARKFMREVLDDPVLNAIPAAAPGLNRFDIENFLTPGSPWMQYESLLYETICTTMADVVDSVARTLGDDSSAWCWGNLHQIYFSHRLSSEEPWRAMKAGPDPVSGSPTTLNMAMHMGPGPGRNKSGEIPCRVYHGPAFRLIVDLADPEHVHFVIAGGNGGAAGSQFATNQYAEWLAGDYLTISYNRDELDIHSTWKMEP